MKARYALIFVGVLAVIAVLTFFFGGLGLLHTKTIGVAGENARREVFEQTQSYVEGKRQELMRYRLQYETTADTTFRKALKYTILQSMANFDRDRLDPSMLAFLESLQK